MTRDIAKRPICAFFFFTQNETSPLESSVAVDAKQNRESSLAACANHNGERSIVDKRSCGACCRLRGISRDGPFLIAWNILGSGGFSQKQFLVVGLVFTNNGWLPAAVHERRRFLVTATKAKVVVVWANVMGRGGEGEGFLLKRERRWWLVAANRKRLILNYCLGNQPPVVRGRHPTNNFCVGHNGFFGTSLNKKSVTLPTTTRASGNVWGPDQRDESLPRQCLRTPLSNVWCVSLRPGDVWRS